MKHLLLVAFMNLETILVNFSFPNELAQWQIVNDGVMGGLSKSEMYLSSEGTAIFSGHVSLDNYGGFASVQRKMNIENVQKHQEVQIKLKGDKKEYQFRLKHSVSEYASYIQTFATSGHWEVITLKLEDLYPSFRGRKLQQPNFNYKTIEQITFLIANKSEEDFRLEIAWIKLVD